jgi:hypothetical protein
VGTQGVACSVEFRGALVLTAGRRRPGQALQAPLQVHQVARAGEQRCGVGEQGLRRAWSPSARSTWPTMVSDMAVLQRSPNFRATARLSSNSSRAADARSFIIKDMASRSRFTLEEARAAGERIGVDWGSAPFDLEQFRMGMDVELEHGTRDPQTNVTDDDLIMTAKIARAHLNEFPDYYTRLAKMEAEAEANGTAQGE